MQKVFFSALPSSICYLEWWIHLFLFSMTLGINELSIGNITNMYEY